MFFNVYSSLTVLLKKTAQDRKSLRSAAEKIAVRSLSPTATALLPTYDKFARI
jgi:hypothetical protein